MSGPFLGVARPPTPVMPPRPLPPRALPPRAPADLPVRRAAPVVPPPTATLVERIDLTDAIAVFRVRADDGPPPFVPGQYLSLGLEIGGSLVQRPYSTASAPGSPVLEFLVRRVEDGTFTPALWSTPAGARLWLGRAKGAFMLRPADPRQAIFVATGTGLAPFVAMLRSMPDRRSGPPPVVVHGVAHLPELAYRSELSALAADGRIAYLPTISRPGESAKAGWSGAVGRVTDTLVAAIVDGVIDPSACVIYLCGNPGMIASAADILLGLGVPSEAMVTERYWDAAGA